MRDNTAWVSEGNVLDDAGNLISTLYVDLRGDAGRGAVPALVKGCRREYALETAGTVLLSKPARFRNFGEALIRDDQEGLAREESVTVQPSTPAETAQQRAVADSNAALQLVDSTMRVTRTQTQERRQTLVRSYAFGNDWWIYCASIKPATNDEWAAWRATLPEEYDHVSEIGQPARFAQALARMVTDQRGPLSGDGWMRDTSSGSAGIRTSHPQQLVIHGPVVYQDSVYEALAQSDDQRAWLAAAIFTKARAYADQREYRFAVFNGKSPEDTVSLRISGMMRDSLEATEGGLTRAFPPVADTGEEGGDRPQAAANDTMTLLRQTRTMTERRTERQEQRSETHGPDGQVQSSEGERRERIEERIVEQSEESEGSTFPAGLWLDREDHAGAHDRPAQELPRGSEPSAEQPDDADIVRDLASREHDARPEPGEGGADPRTIDGLFESLRRAGKRMLEDPTAPMSPVTEPWREAACSPEETARTFGSIDTLELKLTRVAAEHRQDAAAACWHATQCIRNIHARLGDIVDTLWLERERFAVVRLKESKNRQAAGQIAVAPSGAYAYSLRMPGSEQLGHGGAEWGTMFFPTDADIETFEQFGWPAKDG